jgi:monoamine oxidase
MRFSQWLALAVLVYNNAPLLRSVRPLRIISVRCSLLASRKEKKMKHSISRRGFLKQSVAASALYSIPHLNVPDANAKSLNPTATPKKIIIIGAGLAGLSAAYELTQAAHDVTILEARTRAGGRVYTLREPFSDGMYAEAGAIYVPDNHDWTMRYIKLFELSLDSVLPRNLASIIYIRGKRIELKRGKTTDWPLDLTADEKNLGRSGMMEKYIGSILKEISNAAAPDWPPHSLKKYDQMTFSEFLRKQGASSDAVALLRVGYPDLWGDGVDTVSALGLLRDFALGRDIKQVYTIRGGSDLLPKAFAARLTDKVCYGAPVVKIEHNAQGVRVVYLQAGAHKTITADHLICAVPFSVLKQIDISPRFSPEKERAIEQLPYTSVARVYLQTRKRFWLKEGLTGEASTDLPIMSVYDRTVNQRGSRGILESYMAGPQARRATAMKESERISFTLEQMEKVHPAVRDNFEGGTSKCWDEDEWARGDYAWFKPGQMSSLLPHIGRSEGRVHFAGEHASAWPGWMQGALESGNRAAREINEAP